VYVFLPAMDVTGPRGDGRNSQTTHIQTKRYGLINSLTGGKLCNFDERWNPQKLGETLLLLLLGIDID
jgi:hypothetical protein